MKSILDGLQATLGDATAIAASGAPDLSHRGLHELATRSIAALNAHGLGRGDRIAILLPNGPEMAAAFLAVAAGAETAPLNPAYRADELDFYLADLKVAAVLVKAGEDHAIRQVAKDRGSYQYLVESIRRFPTQDTLAGMMTKAGFQQVSYRNLSAGIAALHSGWRI